MVGRARWVLALFMLMRCVMALPQRDISRLVISNQQSTESEKQQSFLLRAESWYYGILCSVWGISPVWLASLPLKIPFLKDRITKSGPPPSCTKLILTVEYGQPQSSDLKKLKESQVPIVWVIGGPGSGKGTLCTMMAEKEGYTHISVGDLIRKEVKNDPNSLKAQLLDSTMKQGALLPESVTQSVLTQEMKAQLDAGSKGFLIDGFPRSLMQAKLFQNKINPPDTIIFLEVSDKTMEERVLKRNDGRADDNKETLKKRLEVFHKQQALVTSSKMFANKVKVVSTEGKRDDNYKKFSEAIHEAIKARNSNIQ